MIQMKFVKGGVIDVPDEPPVISRLMIHGFRQTASPADARKARMTSPVGDAIEIPAQGQEISAAIETGCQMIELVKENADAS